MLDSMTLTTTADKVKGFWNEFDMKKWSQDVGGNYSEAVQAVIYFGVSFGAGFIIKRHFKLIFGCLALSLILIKGMEYYKLLEIDYTAIKDLFGISADKKDFITPLVMQTTDWIKANLIASIAALIGFLIGYKLG
jgi:hypothetical protein